MAHQTVPPTPSDPTTPALLPSRNQHPRRLCPLCWQDAACMERLCRLSAAQADVSRRSVTCIRGTGASAIVPQVYPPPASSATAFNVLPPWPMCCLGAEAPPPPAARELGVVAPAPAPAFAETAPLARIPPGPSEPALTLIPSLPSTAGASSLSSSPSPSSSCHQRDHRTRRHRLRLRRALQPRPGPVHSAASLRVLPAAEPHAVRPTAPPTLPRLTLGLPPGWYALCQS